MREGEDEREIDREKGRLIEGKIDERGRETERGRERER